MTWQPFSRMCSFEDLSPRPLTVISFQKDGSPTLDGTITAEVKSKKVEMSFHSPVYQVPLIANVGEQVSIQNFLVNPTLCKYH